MWFKTFKNNQQGAASPAQLVHDFECLPHVPRVESDGTRPLRSVFFLQRVWTESSAPERDGSQRRTLRTIHVSLAHPQQHVGANDPTAHFRVVYLTFVHFSCRNKISVQKEEQTSRAGASGELTIRSASITMHVQQQPWCSLSLWRSMCTWPCRRCRVLSLSPIFNFLSGFMSNWSETTGGIEHLATVWHVNVVPFAPLLSVK